jgi:hypothetical protein
MRGHSQFGNVLKTTISQFFTVLFRVLPYNTNIMHKHMTKAEAIGSKPIQLKLYTHSLEFSHFSHIQEMFVSLIIIPVWPVLPFLTESMHGCLQNS